MKPRHTVVMVTTSYPRFAGDMVGTFMEPIAHGVAARGHEVHLVAPWHPQVARRSHEGNVHFHFFRYAPFASLNVFGYSGSLRADVQLRAAAYAVAPLALACGIAAARSVARRVNASVMHGHWVIPGGAIAAAGARGRPLVISLHGSDVYVAERVRLARIAARWAFGRARWVTACSEDLRQRAIRIGARPESSEVLPYGVDADRFKPDPSWRAARRRELGLDDDTPMVLAAGRLVRKKGFEYLLDAVASLTARWPDLVLVLAGSGDLDAELRARAAERSIADRVRFLGTVAQSDVAELLATADVAVIPSVRDESGNVDGLPNVVMEALASGTAVVTTSAGGIGAVVESNRTAVVVPERDAGALACAIEGLLDNDGFRRQIGDAARAAVLRRHGWERVAERFEEIYDRVSRNALVAGPAALPSL